MAYHVRKDGQAHACRSAHRGYRVHARQPNPDGVRPHGYGAMKANIKAWCLSLPRSVERRRQFDAEAARAGLAFEYVDGLDARGAEAGELSRLANQRLAEQRFGRRLLPGEIACAEGHLRIYRRLLDSDAEAALIFEDDALLAESFRDVLKGLAGLGSEFMHRRLVLLLNDRQSYQAYPLWVRRRRKVPVASEQGLLEVVRSDNALHGTFGYMITRNAAAVILDAEREISVPADAWDILWKSGVLQSIWVLDPPAIFHPASREDGSIGQERALIEAQSYAELHGETGLRKLLRIFSDRRRIAASVAHRLRWRQLKCWTYALLSQLS